VASAYDGIFAPGRRRLTVGIVAVITIAAFEGMAVATAMPAIAADLDGLRWYAWSFSIFAVTSLWAMVWAGESADQHGPRRPLILALTAFAAGLALAGVAPSMGVLVAARGLQGLGGGAAIVAIYVLVARCYAESLRPRVFSALAAAWVIPAIVGPAAAGYLADGPGWRWVFLGVLLVIPGCLALVLPTLRAQGGPLGEVSATRPGRKRRALVVALAATALQYAGSRLDLIGLIVAVPAVAALVVAAPPLLPAGVFRLSRGLPTAVALRGVMAGAFFGAEVYVPLMLVSERGLSSAQAGLALTVGALGWAGGSQLQARLPWPRARFVQVGCAVTAVSIAALAVSLSPDLPAATAIVAWAFGGLGMGLAMPSFSVIVLAESPVEAQGVNSSALQLSDALGSVLLVGATGVFFAFAAAEGDPAAWVFAVIFTAMAAVAAAGASVGGRAAPRHAAATSAVVD
jgi:MFS family permease